MAKILIQLVDTRDGTNERQSRWNESVSEASREENEFVSFPFLLLLKTLAENFSFVIKIIQQVENLSFMRVYVTSDKKLTKLLHRLASSPLKRNHISHKWSFAKQIALVCAGLKSLGE